MRTDTAQRRLPPRARSAGPSTARRRNITLQSDGPARAHVWGKQAERSEAVGGIPALGTPETLTDASGNVTHQAFDPFGTRRYGGPGPATRVGYTGHHQDDDLGLIDMGGRVYDPLAGRFTTADPIMQAPYWSQGQNRYAYVFNDPLNNTDPSGFMSSSEMAGGASPALIGGGITGGAYLATHAAGLSGWSIGGGAVGGLGNAANTLMANPFQGSSGGTQSLAAPSGAANTNPVKPGGTNAVGQANPPGAMQPLPSAAEARAELGFADERTAELTACRGKAAASMACSPSGLWGSPGGVVVKGAAQVAPSLLSRLWQWIRGARGAPNFTRALQASDFGAKATVEVIQGTLSVQDKVATVGIKYIQGNLGNPVTALNALKATAREAGATTLRIEATIANPRLEPVLTRLLGPATRGAAGGAQDIWVLGL